MAASALTTGGGWVNISLRDIPKDLRLSVARELADRWRLRGMDCALFLLAAERPSENPELRVPADKALLVMAGKRPRGSLPDDLKIPPVMLDVAGLV